MKPSDVDMSKAREHYVLRAHLKALNKTRVGDTDVYTRSDITARRFATEEGMSERLGNALVWKGRRDAEKHREGLEGDWEVVDLERAILDNMT